MMMRCCDVVVCDVVVVVIVIVMSCDGKDLFSSGGIMTWQ